LINFAEHSEKFSHDAPNRYPAGWRAWTLLGSRKNALKRVRFNYQLPIVVIYSKRVKPLLLEKPKDVQFVSIFGVLKI
jgi:hypothetical protein